MISETAFSIRPLQAWSEYLDAEELQRAVWQMPDWRDVVPANLLITAHKHGGIVLGAFDATQRLIGLAFSFLGTDAHHANRLKHCSHMVAVLPEFQGQGIGEQLKFVQRQIALAQKIDLMTWTYDPLLALNANLNLVRLGAIARHYIVNAYGKMTDGLNAGLPSDRFQVEWWMNTARVESRATQPPPRRDWNAMLATGVQPLFEVLFDAKELPRIEKIYAAQRDVLLVEIPANFAAVKNFSADLALAWRMHAREAFQNCFAAGYSAIDFVFSKQPSRAAYLLSRAPLDPSAVM